jgi:malate dehydrogenase
VVVGVPVKLGREGVREVIQVQLSPGERDELMRSAEAVRETIAVLG